LRVGRKVEMKAVMLAAYWVVTRVDQMVWM